VERREVVFSGYVQGVGFRYTAQRLAAGLPVTGYVQNRPDGSVLLVAEGPPATLDAFLSALRSEMGRHIRGVETVAQPASGEFADFRVRM
jgi:acylphosphatase